MHKHTSRSPQLARRTRRSALVAAIALPIAALAACGGGSTDDTIELTFTTAASEAQSTDWLWLTKQVEERTNGRVTFRNYFNGSLGDAADTLKAVQDGRAQVGWVTPTYQPADFPVWSVNQVQYISSNPEAVSHAVYDEYTEGSLLTEDFEDSGIKPIGFITYGPNIVGTSDPIRSLDDLKGQVMRSAGTSDQIMKAAGARPTTLAVNEVFESLERGTIDGFTQLPFATPAKVGLSEVTSYLTDIGSGAYSTAAYAMSQSAWAGLPEDVKDVFLEVSGEFVERYFVEQAAIDQEACDTYRKDGTQLSRLPEPEIDELRNRSLGDLIDAWKATAADAGFDKAELNDYFTSYTDKIKAAEPTSTSYKNPFETCS